MESHLQGADKKICGFSSPTEATWCPGDMISE